MSSTGPTQTRRHCSELKGAGVLGHFGGDEGLCAHFADVVAAGASADVRTPGRISLAGHLLGFAAEHARERGTVVECAAFEREAAEGAARLARAGAGR